MATKRQIASERKAAAEKLETVRLQAETKAMERTLQLLESPQPVVVPYYEYPAFDAFSGWPSSVERPYFWSSIDDRTEGRYRPLYEDANDLRRMRADARRLRALFPVIEGVMETLTNYTIKNLTFTVEMKGGGESALTIEIQRVIDSFLERNEFVGNLDRTIFANSREDGEVFAALYPDGRDVRLELIDPEYIAEPANKTQLERMLSCGHKMNYWWHGVHTQFDRQLKRDDVARPLGYHAVFDPVGDQWDYLPAYRVEHIKRNVGTAARRGVSDFTIVLSDVEREARIRRNTAEGAALLAAIVMIRQHAEGVSRSTIESMVSTNATTSSTRATASGGTATTYAQQLQPGTVKDIPHGMTAMVGPMGTLNQPIYIQVSQYLLRIIGQRWSMPEYMVSGDASNAAYASTLVAESPFVKSCEHAQEFYAAAFVRLLWKVLAMYYRAGALRGGSWQQIREQVEITAGYTSPASRDKLQQAQTNKILSDSGVLSKRTWAADCDLEYEDEQRAIAEEPKAVTPPQLLPFTGMQPIQQPSQFRTESLAIRAMDLLLERQHAAAQHQSGS